MSALKYLLIFVSSILLYPAVSFSQTDTSICLTFDFNNREIKENNNKIAIKPVGVSLTYDRFGNDDMAVYVSGHSESYLNLGTSPLLKSPDVSISMWVKLERKVYIGSGYGSNPMISISNGPGEDFTNALAMGYDWPSKRITVNSTKDEIDEAVIIALDTFEFNKWNHLVFICNNKYMAFYRNGELQGKVTKNFETKYLVTDSLMIGHSASIKNKRFSQGVFDDIQIFHKALSPEQILELYNAPNPNWIRNLLNEALKYFLIVLVFGIIIIALVFRNRRQLKKQKQELELATRIAELELKVIKSQMNPHFISNSLAAIQDLNYNLETEKAGLYIAKFSYFLRQILNYSDEDYISISEEIVMIRLFVELEQLRFKNGFAFDLIVDDIFSKDEVLIPSLITQPFIENAIWHGLLPLKNARDPKLTIKIISENGLPVIEIEDNGIGRNADRKEKQKGKGTQLVIDKIDTLNRPSRTSNYKIQIIDLIGKDETKMGTKIIIYLDAVKE